MDVLLNAKLTAQVLVQGQPADRDVVVLERKTDGSWSVCGSGRSGGDGVAQIQIEAAPSSLIYAVSVDEWGVPFVPMSLVHVGDVVRPSQYEGYLYRVLSAGQLPQSEPAWIQQVGSIQSVGTVTVQCERYWRPLAHGPVPVVFNGLWSPRYLSAQPQIWLDWESEVSEASNGSVIAWTNRGAVGGAFTQSTAAWRPLILSGALAGKRALAFDGIDDFLVGAGTESLTRNISSCWAVAVYKKRDLALNEGEDQAVIFATRGAIGENARFFLGHSALGSSSNNRPVVGGRRLDGDAFGRVEAPPETVSRWVMQLGVLNYAENVGELYLDGSLVNAVSGLWASGGGHTSDTPSLLPIGIGGNPSAFRSRIDADIAFVMMGTNELPTPHEFDCLFGWLAAECGLATRLPDDHPFRHVPPYIQTPELQLSLSSEPMVFGFVAEKSAAVVGVAAGQAVSSKFGTMFHGGPELGSGAGIEVICSDGNLEVRLIGVDFVVLPTTAVVMDHKGDQIAVVSLTGNGDLEGSALAVLQEGGVYYVRLEQGT